MNEANDVEQTVGQALVGHLERRGVEVVFGIPGVHTIELYRGLGDSGIRHVTPRHEQGAGFMADGYSRVTGRVGVAFVITGPGMTNVLTAMGQALADSIPMLVVSSVNEGEYLGRGLGHLHELPDQAGLSAGVSRRSEHVAGADELLPALDSLFATITRGRPGPIHLQLPLDVLGQPAPPRPSSRTEQVGIIVEPETYARAQALLNEAERPVVIVGGGAIDAEPQLRSVAQRLDAPVILTINARGMLADHPLRVPASPVLPSVARLIEDADVVLAVGTELGPTDFDIYNTGSGPEIQTLIRIDIDQAQLERIPAALTIRSWAAPALRELVRGLDVRQRAGADRAASAWTGARAELPDGYLHLVELVETLRDTIPNSVMVGDSTQLLYAANMAYGHDRPRGWFNSSVGFGSLGYAIPAAVGASIGAPDAAVVCMTGDGGAQFTLSELMVAAEENLPILFVIWNNFGFQEIADAMESAGAEVIGCTPQPPDFGLIAAACGIPYVLTDDTPDHVASAAAAWTADHPQILEIRPR